MTTQPTVEAATPIMSRLKEETADLHHEAENHPFQQALVRGELPLEAYGSHLGQLRLVYGALERALAGLRDSRPDLAPIIEDRRFHEQKLASDARFVGSDDKPAPSVPTQKLIDDIAKAARENPIALLGFFYVLEGSTNGGRFIAGAVRKAYGFEGIDGTRALDPYGEDQRGLWGEFKQGMGRLPFTEDEQDSMIRAADRMFRAIAEIGGANRA